LFVRGILPVTDERGRPVRAWVYVYNLPVSDLPRIVSGNFSEDDARSG